MDPCFETATGLGRAIRNGRLSSAEATEAHLQRIAQINGQLNALVVIDRAGVMKAARAADRARAKKGAKLGPLHGVPITIKEAFDVARLATTSSHPPLKDNIAGSDASLVETSPRPNSVGTFPVPPTDPGGPKFVEAGCRLRQRAIPVAWAAFESAWSQSAGRRSVLAQS